MMRSERKLQLALNELIQVLDDVDSPLYSKIQKFLDDCMHDYSEQMNFRPRRFELDQISEFPLWVTDAHLRYQQLVEAEFTDIISSHGLDFAVFVDYLFSVHKRNKDDRNLPPILNSIQALIDFDVFCTMIEDFKNDRF